MLRTYVILAHGCVGSGWDRQKKRSVPEASTRSAPHCCSSQLGFELDYLTDLLNRTPLFGGKITPKIKLLYGVPYRWRDQKNLNFHVFFSSTLIGKNISIRVERHKLLLCISKEQANEKDHYSINSKKKRKKPHELPIWE